MPLRRTRARIFDTARASQVKKPNVNLQLNIWPCKPFFGGSGRLRGSQTGFKTQKEAFFRYQKGLQTNKDRRVQLSNK